MITAPEIDLDLMRMQVAEKLGWRSIEYSKDGYLIGYPAGRKLFAVIPSYVRDIRAAWSLIEYLSIHGINTHLDAGVKDAKRTFSAQMEYHGKSISRAEAPTAPLSICQAFLGMSAKDLSCSFVGARS